MTEDPQQIAHRDWRLHAITTTSAPFKSTATGFEHPAGTVVELAGTLVLGREVFNVPVPDAAAMYVSLAESASHRGRHVVALLQALPDPASRKLNAIPNRRVDEKLETEYVDALQELAATVIFSYSAIEALANQLIPQDYRYRRVRGDGRCTEEYDRDQIERFLPLDEKLSAVLPPLRSVDSPKGTKLWERFVRLERLRNRLIHLKRNDWRNLQPQDAPTSIWSDLVSPDVPHLYKVAIDIAVHFTVNDVPRWVSKAVATRDRDAV